MTLNNAHKRKLLELYAMSTSNGTMLLSSGVSKVHQHLIDAGLAVLNGSNLSITEKGKEIAFKLGRGK